MTRIVICPQRHIWWPTGSDGDEQVLICPVCGQSGAPVAVVPTGRDSLLETLAPADVPPVVNDLTFILPTAWAAEKAVDADAPSVPGYDIIRELGRGGMGVVYLARHRELKRQVALKMILAGGHIDPETRKRFHREAQAVARLQHPGIVQIHDVGEHDGRPYLALEYVQGISLDVTIAGTPLAARHAARVIETVANAIHYAHQQGIVHRDLTPRNILVARGSSNHAIPLNDVESERYDFKITDFGLAKELDDDNNRTQTGVIMGTPNYMSPEQALGRQNAIGPATDVHALGAVFYELLTGRPPFLAETRLDTLTQVVEIDPVAPTRLQPRIPRDAETICLKCLAKDPHRRYPSAQELADDLHRFLTNEPIRARPVPWRERAAKWVRRHPAATALLAVVALSLATLIAGSFTYNARIRGESERFRGERDRAEKNFDHAMLAVDEMLSEVGEKKLADVPGMEETRRNLLEKALALNLRFLNQKSEDSRVRFESAHAYRRLADVFRLLERHDSAIEAYGQAIALFARLHDEAPRDPKHRRQLAYCHNFLGEVLRAAGRHAEAQMEYREADRILRNLVAEFANEPDDRQDQAQVSYNLGILLLETRHLPEAETELRKAADLLTDLVKIAPANPAYRQHLARAFLNLGTVLRSAERPGEARVAYDKAIDLLRPLIEADPKRTEYRQELAVACNNAGNLLADNREFDEARRMHDQALALYRKLADDSPSVPGYRQELANTWNSIGNVESLQERHADTLHAWNQAASLLEELQTQYPKVAVYQGDLGMVLGNLGLVHKAQSQLAEARSHLERSVKWLQSTLAASPGHAIYRECLRDSYQNLAEVLVVSGDHAAAAEAARTLTGVYPESSNDHYVTACFLARCAGVAKDDPSLGSERRPALTRLYADESMANLQMAIKKGFDDLSQLQKDRDPIFEAVQMRPEFEVLIRDLAARTEKRG